MRDLIFELVGVFAIEKVRGKPCSPWQGRVSDKENANVSTDMSGVQEFIVLADCTEHQHSTATCVTFKMCMPTKHF